MPPQPEAAVYRKFRSRSSEDRPCVAVAAVRDGDALRVVVGAVAETPQHFPDVCALGAGARRPRSAPPTASGSSRSPTRAARPRTGAG